MYLYFYCKIMKILTLLLVVINLNHIYKVKSLCEKLARSLNWRHIDNLIIGPQSHKYNWIVIVLRLILKLWLQNVLIFISSGRSGNKKQILMWNNNYILTDTIHRNMYIYFSPFNSQLSTDLLKCFAYINLFYLLKTLIINHVLHFRKLACKG